MRILGIFLLGLLVAESYKILVYNSQYGHSHSNFMARIADVLVDAGHNVTSLIPVIGDSVGASTKSSTIYVAQGAATSAFMEQYSGTKPDMFDMNSLNPLGSLFLGHLFSSMFGLQCRAVLEEHDLIELLRDEKYDVMITENTDVCGTALTELIKPKSFILTASSMTVGPQFEEFGMPTSLSSNPEPYVSRMNVHSMWDRAVNIYANLLVRYSFGSIRTAIDSLFKEKFGPSFRSVLEISADSAYIFVNSEPLIDIASPTMAKARCVIYIGGIGVKEPKKLNDDWEKILAKREKTVLLSFGSVTKSAHLSMPIKTSIIETVKSLPHATFIWKYEDDDEFTKHIASKIPNLELTKWMPQVDLLAHPNLSAFMTHGGMGSTQETAWRGVPGIFVPLFGDQHRNAEMMEHNGIGKVMSKHDFADPAKFTAVVREVLENESYRKNAKRISGMLHKKPFAVRDLIVKYTEFAAEFGAATSLRPQSHDMSWIEYHNMDIILIVLIIALIGQVIHMKIMMRVVNGMFCAWKSKKDTFG